MKSEVTFKSNSLTLAAHLYSPEKVPAPAIVVGHPTTGVKEQTAAIYAQRLAEQGFITLAFDAAYQGESEGEPRGLEDPFQRADDFRAAVSYLAARDDVTEIGVLGICGSGGYGPYAAQTDHRMKAVATISAVNVPDFFRAASPEGFQQMVEESGALRTEEEAGKPAHLVSALPDSVDDSTPAGVREFFDYYRTPRGHHPRSTNLWVMRSADQLDQYDSYADAAKIAPRPLLMIAGDRKSVV